MTVLDFAQGLSDSHALEVNMRTDVPFGHVLLIGLSAASADLPAGVYVHPRTANMVMDATAGWDLWQRMGDETV